MDCKGFKNGKFKIVDPNLGIVVIDRKDDKQIEYNEGHKLKLEYLVKWVNACTYTLELNRILENPNKIELTQRLILTVEIIEAKERSYIQRTSSNMYDIVMESELVKMD